MINNEALMKENEKLEGVASDMLDFISDVLSDIRIMQQQVLNVLNMTYDKGGYLVDKDNLYCITSKKEVISILQDEILSLNKDIQVLKRSE